MLDMMNEARRDLGRKLQRAAAPRLEAALVQYPFRGAAARDPSAAILAQPLLLDQDRSIAEIKDLAVSPASFQSLFCQQKGRQCHCNLENGLTRGGFSKVADGASR